MNIEQMRAWLALEGYSLCAATWKDTGKRMGVWTAIHADHEYQAFERQPPDTWARYVIPDKTNASYADVPADDIPSDVIAELFRTVIKEIQK